MFVRPILALAIGVVAFIGAAIPANVARADNYPSRPIRLIVPFPAGGPTDVQARIVAQEMSKALGQQIVIDNRGGAGGNIAAEAAANSAPDGYTIFFATGGTHGINPNLYKKIPYDAVKSFDPVVLISTSPNIFVANQKFPASTMAELIEYARKNPGIVNYATAGIGATTHMGAELLQSMTGIKMVHVPYRGGGPAMNDLLGGQIELMVDGLPSAMPHIKAGSIKALGLTTSTRAASAPEIPTVAETVPGYETSAWFGLVVPKGTPKEVIDKLNTIANAALKTDLVKTRYAELGADPVGGSAQDLERQITSELAKWAEVVKATGAHVD
ncbi:MAG: tripartite tricarboxylate transporter substrate binding protein [Tardiphaga sp.]|nr:tripartite tricarboxylate transporter substrate binding protein [Tardiphaga sp.]